MIEGPLHCFDLEPEPVLDQPDHIPYTDLEIIATSLDGWAIVMSGGGQGNGKQPRPRPKARSKEVGKKRRSPGNGDLSEILYN